MNKSDKIIVSFTSWEKRIHNTAHTFNLMLKQTLKPDVIVLNLSIEEFPNKEAELPKELIEIVAQNTNCRINWVAKNTTVWKKFLPILNEYPNDPIIPIDDDIEYPVNYVEVLYNEYIKWNRQCPIVCFPNVRNFGNAESIYGHSGPFSLIKKDFFGKYLDDIYSRLVEPSVEDRYASDEIYSYCVWLNGLHYKFTDKINGKYLYDSSEKNKKDAYSMNYSSSYRQRLAKNTEKVMSFIKKEYSDKFNSLFSAPIYVNITTWTMRDKYLPKMLQHLTKQTKHPDKIILWLSKDEYNEKALPKHITDCLTKHLLTEIRWVDKNIYCHKRHEIFKTNNNVFNIFMDDDIYYDVKHIENLYNAGRQHPDCVISMYGYQRSFINGKPTRVAASKDPSIKNVFMGGLSCFPPYTFPMESFNFTDIRDKVATKCDETWVGCWLFKNKTKVMVLNNWDNVKLKIKYVDDSQKNAMWNENKVNVGNGLIRKDKLLFNTLYALGLVQDYKTMYPNAKIVVDDIDDSKKKIVTMTSWAQRISNIPTVLDSIYKQTVKPNKIVVNLSVEEFPNKEKDLPGEVVNYLDKHKDIEVYWIGGKNRRQWKKLIPTLLRYPNDWVICIDDDRIYPSTFIDNLWKKHIECPNNAITLNRSYKVNGHLQHCGHGTLSTLSFFNGFKNIDLEELYDKTESSDTFFNYMLTKYHHDLIFCGTTDTSKTYNEVSPLSKSKNTKNTKSHTDTWSWLCKRYGDISGIRQVSQIRNNIQTKVSTDYDYITRNLSKSTPVTRTIKTTTRPKHVIKKTKVFLGTGLNW